MKRILVVDDEVDILFAIEIILNNSGFDVETTPKWEKMSSSIMKFNPDLILLDVSLSGADGRDLCFQLKGSSNTKHILVILVSAHHNLINNLKACKPDAVIIKPFDAKHLVKIVASHVN
jgi:DNA-binding response OmpR family regulator